MNKVVIGILAAILIAGGVYFAVKNGFTVSFNKPNPVALKSPEPLLGGDKDEHGCIPSAGYGWCDAKQKCLRSWEEPCEASSAKPSGDENSILIEGVKSGLVAEHGQDAASMTITVSTIEGDYAKGMASEQGGGGIWFAAKAGGVWKLVWDGNGIIQCGDLDSYPDFPTSMIPNCFDSSTNNLITRK